jgi:DNA-binding NarL/FixJ family response regulator
MPVSWAVCHGAGRSLYVFVTTIMPSRILIADDSGVFRKAVRTYLTQLHFEVCGEAIDGNDVLQKATELQPALIILDLRMPNMNGVEVASVLKGRMPNVRIVLLTMYDEVMGYKSLMSAIGVDATIPKMNCFDSLAECVRGLLSHRRPEAPETNRTSRLKKPVHEYGKHLIP